MRARLRAWWPSAAWAAAVVAVSSIPRLRVPFATFRNVDKLAHATEYAVLGLLLAFGAARDPRTRRVGALAAALGVIAAIALFGALDELHQSWIPGRSTSGWDWLADVLGATLGASLGAWAWRRRAAPRDGAGTDAPDGTAPPRPGTGGEA